MKPGRVKRLFVSVFVISVFLVAVLALLHPDTGWRFRILGLKASGKLPEIGWLQLVPMLKPGSGFWLRPLLDDRSLYAVIQNPLRSETDREKGKALFRSTCQPCHGGHESDPELLSGNLLEHYSDWALFQTITEGVPGTGMQPVDLDAPSVWQIMAYLRSNATEGEIQEDSVPAGSEVHTVVESVTQQQLLQPESKAQNWLHYSGGYSGHRYSVLNSINADSVGELELAWVYQISSEEPHIESTPLVIAGRMYFTASPNQDLALEAASGRLLWKKKYPLTENLKLCCGPHNRGFAAYQDKLFRGTLDAHLLARNATDGKLLWAVEVEKAEKGYSITSAPLVVDGKVIIGVGGGEFGIRGFLDAYEASTGRRIWRTYTIPEPDEPGGETWAGDSWKMGGGPTWMTGSYDPELNLIYWGVGNPSPDFNGDSRMGDNLYTNSVLALDADTGRIRWYFQFTPHDEHDWDSNQVPVLVDAVISGVSRKLLVTANKNGFAYVLDRRTGEYLHAFEIAEQSWAQSLDASGRPVVFPNIAPTKKGRFLRPSTAGATNWWPPSYNPSTGLFYVPVLESGSIYFKGFPDLIPGELLTGSVGLRANEPYYTALRAFDIGTGQLVWEHRLASRKSWAALGGTLTTAGNLLFFGDRSFFYALDARDGRVLWRRNLGAMIHSAPMSYRVGEKQYIAVIAGRSLFVFSD